LDSWFLYDCRNLSHCFGCTNLRNKQYYFFNQPLTKEEYEQKMSQINTASRKVLAEYQQKFAQILKTAIHRGVNNVKAENCLGDLLHNSRNCFYCFKSFKGGVEDSRYICDVEKASDLMDVFGGNNFSLCYESTGIAESQSIKFSLHIRNNSQNLEYCQECQNCQDCFACIGLKNKKYCIFNQQFSEMAYWQMLDKIKTEMLRKGEYGEFFPLSISLAPYYDSSAQVEFPLTKEEILNNGWRWQEQVKSDIDLSQFAVIQAKDLPDDIANVSDDILNKVVICEQTQKPFRLTGLELDFYRKHNLPLPIIHPLQRLKNRFAFRHPFRLWQYPCSLCGQPMHSCWDPAKHYKVFCDPCYLKEIV